MNNEAKQLTEEINDILGFGKIIKILTGTENGKPIIEEFHITPATLEELPELYSQLDIVTKIEDFTNKKGIEDCAKLIFMATKTMHPDLSVEDIKKKFGLVALAQSIAVISDVNDFLAEMGKMTDKMKEVEKVTR